MNVPRKMCGVILTLAGVLVLARCGGGTSSQSQPPPAVTYKIGGTVVGLSGTGLTLQDNGGDNLPISVNGAFTFATAITSGATYRVTVLTQPSTPAQNCTVLNNTASAKANVTDIEVACVSEWTWVDGLTVASTYGPYGTAPPPNTPGARDGAQTWTDPQGNLWLYGGECLYAVQGGYYRQPLSDLWEYSSGQWTLVNGTNAAGSPPSWGQMGVAAGSNTPGQRGNAATWTDANGNLWLFGGANYNDLWKFIPSTSQWTWVGGSNVANQSGTYGTLGTADPNNIPGARSAAVSWTDGSGNFWLFGGSGNASAGSAGVLNDLWEYNPSTAEWTWVGGSNLANQPGVYGTPGVAAPGNIPGQRFAAVGSIDASNNLWLFGGMYWIPTGPGSATGANYGDLWRYSPNSNEWACMSGCNQINQSGTYGTKGIPAAGNAPGSRFEAVSWVDSKGNFWLFSGYGAAGIGGGTLNDLWEYSAGQWTWMGGSNGAFQPGVYGSTGVPDPNNIPGARSAAVSWTDKSGHLWLFGGQGTDSTGTVGWLNDLWEYQP